MSEDLKKRAQAKLSEARALIAQAGELAKEGQFMLEFGEIGTFIPQSMLDRTALREQATLEAKAEGRVKHGKYDPEKKEWERTVTPFDQLDEDEQEALIEQIVDEHTQDLPYEVREYGLTKGDRWWHPSRC